MENKILVLGVVLLALVFVFGCLGTQNKQPQVNKTPSGTGAGTSVKFDITIANFAFDPQNATVNVGNTVVWTNTDAAAHKIVEDNGLFESGAIQKDGSFTYTFDKTGTYTYHCSIHPSMTGKIVVQ